MGAYYERIDSSHVPKAASTPEYLNNNRKKKTIETFLPAFSSVGRVDDGIRDSFVII